MITELKESRENYITYKNFRAKVLPYFCGEEGYRGQVMGIKDHISFYGQTKEETEKAMQEAVDYYLSFNLDCEVEETIEKFIDEERLFTAYDITRYLRKQFPKEEILHYKVREIVENLYQRDREESDYTRTLIDVGKEIQPWLYHHKDLPTDQVKKLYDAQSNKDKNQIADNLIGLTHVTCKFGGRK